jgi:dolichyl-phosphate-mannose--protein O-mannosyl transferase
MNKNKFINHMNYHFMKYLIGIPLFIFLNMFIYRFITDYNESQKEDYSFLRDFVYDVYQNEPSLFKFNNNKAILKMDELYTEREENPNGTLSPIYNKDFDQCAGYIIINKNDDNTINIDVSHVCEMIDY